MQPASSNLTGRETAIALPTGLLLGTVLSVAALEATAWFMVARIGGWDAAAQMGGLLGGVIVAVTGAAGVLIMRPWTVRPISWWMTMWLAATVLRLLGTPALTFVLYSAASLDGMSLAISVAVAYLAVLLTEAVVLARYVNQRLYPATGGDKPARFSASNGS